MVSSRIQGIEVRRASGILAGIGGLPAHLAAPEMPDLSVLAGEDRKAGHVFVLGADIVAGVFAAGIGEHFQIGPAPQCLGLQIRLIGERAIITKATRSSMSAIFFSQVAMKDVQLGHKFLRAGPNMKL